jgi:hypothetical protein
MVSRAEQSESERASARPRDRIRNIWGHLACQEAFWDPAAVTEHLCDRTGKQEHPGYEQGPHPEQIDVQPGSSKK